jgi:hypothetical protein
VASARMVAGDGIPGIVVFFFWVVVVILGRCCIGRFLGMLER